MILLDEVICGSSRENDSSSELTFGFDINEQLLRNEEEKVSEVVPVIVERSVETAVEKSAEKRVDKAERKIKLKIVETLVIEDFCARFEQPPDKVFNFNNMEKVISHHKTGEFHSNTMFSLCFYSFEKNSFFIRYVFCSLE